MMLRQPTFRRFAMGPLLGAALATLTLAGSLPAGGDVCGFIGALAKGFAVESRFYLILTRHVFCRLFLFS